MIKENNSKVSKKTEVNKKVKIIKFKDLEGKFLHVTVGNNDHPSTDEQIKEVQEQIIDLFEKNNVNCLVYVTHHMVSMEIIEKKINED